jgi:hypothetical protein
LSVNGPLPGGIVASSYDPATGILRLTGTASHADYDVAIHQVEFSTTEAIGKQKQIEVIVFDGQEWSPEAKAFIKISGATATDVAPPALDLGANNSNGGGADYTATFTSGGPAMAIADIDVSITGIDRQPPTYTRVAVRTYGAPLSRRSQIGLPPRYRISHRQRGDAAKLRGP